MIGTGLEPLDAQGRICLLETSPPGDGYLCMTSAEAVPSWPALFVAWMLSRWPDWAAADQVPGQVAARAVKMTMSWSQWMAQAQPEPSVSSMLLASRTPRKVASTTPEAAGGLP